MKKYRKLFAPLVVAVWTFTLSQPVLAAPIELSLDDAVALALKNNSDIKIASFDREKSLWAITQAEAGKGFALTYSHSDERYNTPPSSLTGYKYVWTTKFDNEFAVSLPVYSGRKLESLIDQAQLNFKIADLNVDATRQQLRQTVTTDYFTVLQYRNALAISTETVDNYASHLKNVQAQFDVGIVAKSDVLASEVSLANAQDGLIKSENNYQLAVATLNNAVGLPLSSDIKLKEDLKYEKYAPTLDACAGYALANRPEIAEYQAKIAVAHDDVKIAKSGYLPTVSFAAAEDWYDKELPGTKNNNWLVSLTASLDLFDSGLTQAKVRQAQFGVATAEEQFRQKRDAILLEVRQYYLSMREAEKRIDTSTVAVDQAVENLRIAELRYTAGVGTNLDVLDAVLSLNQAKTNYVQALYDYNTSKTELDKAMGVAVK